MRGSGVPCAQRGPAAPAPGGSCFPAAPCQRCQERQWKEGGTGSHGAPPGLVPDRELAAINTGGETGLNRINPLMREAEKPPNGIRIERGAVIRSPDG